MPLLNCYIVAWRKYASGEAQWMACKKSEFSKFLDKPWAVVRAVGDLTVWTASAFWLLGHFMRFGTWPHWIYCTEINGECSEYYPLEEKHERAIPPIIYRGEERRMNKDRRCSDCKHRGTA